MILIFGGAYQGKLTWAAKEYELKQEEILDLATEEFRPGFRCYTHLESLTRRGGTVELPAETIVISREVGSGVVPMDAGERLWREAHGALLRRLADQAEHVVRIFCGLPEVLK